MKLIIVLSVIIFKFAFLDNAHATTHGDEASRVAKKYVDDVIKNDNLQFLGYSGALYENIEKLDFYFASNCKKDISSSREEIVKLIEKCLFYINNDIEIRPYLKDKPFTEKNLRISIEYLKNIDRCDSSKFYEVVLLLGDLDFYPYRGNKPILEESYQEAKRKI